MGRGAVYPWPSFPPPALSVKISQNPSVSFVGEIRAAMSDSSEGTVASHGAPTQNRPVIFTALTFLAVFLAMWISQPEI